MFKRWFLNEVAGYVSILSGGLQRMGYGEGLTRKARRERMKESLERRMRTLRRTDRRNRGVVEREAGKRRRLGEKGLGVRKSRGCVKEERSLEFRHEEAHFIL